MPNGIGPAFSSYLAPRRCWVWLGWFFIVLGIFAALVADGVQGEEWWANTVWCAIAGVAILFALKNVLAGGLLLVLSDHLVMLSIAFFSYFVVGAALLSLGPQEQIDASLSFYRVDAHEALRVNAANSIGFGFMVLAAAFSPTRWSGGVAALLSIKLAKFPPGLAILLFLFVGLAASAQVVAVDLTGGGDIVDGSIRLLSKFSLVAIYLGASYSGRGGKWIRLSVAISAVLLSLLGLLLFNKTEIFLPLGVLFVGMAVRKSSNKILFFGVLSIVVLFVAVGNVVAYSRNTYSEPGRDHVGARLQVLVEGIGSSSRNTLEGEFHPWARFCYTPSFAAGMYLYDVGRGGQDFERLPWILVPRFLSADKPVISQAGGEFYTKITGQVGSSNGLGVFVSGYYNLGWAGLVLASLMCGWVLAQTSRIASEILSKNASILMPFALIGVYMAFRVDGHFVTDYLGVYIFLLYPMVVSSLFFARR